MFGSHTRAQAYLPVSCAFHSYNSQNCPIPLNISWFEGVHQQLNSPWMKQNQRPFNDIFPHMKCGLEPANYLSEIKECWIDQYLQKWRRRDSNSKMGTYITDFTIICNLSSLQIKPPFLSYWDREICLGTITSHEKFILYAMSWKMRNMSFTVPQFNLFQNTPPFWKW